MTADEITAGDIMIPRVISLTVNTYLKDAIRTLLSAKISGAPVVDQDGRLIGIITEEDLIGIVGEYGLDFADVPIGQIRSLGTSIIVKDVRSVTPDVSLRDIVTTLIIRKVKRLPVIDNNRRVIGVVDRRDVLRAMVGVNEDG